jgi:predicted CXXCH cytochrome family protein
VDATGPGTPLFGSEGMCYSCHKTEPRGGKFFEPGHSHPVNVPVPPGMIVPKELGTVFVKDVGEVVTCSSCHDPHNRRPGLLKKPVEGDTLCVACHKM